MILLWSQEIVKPLLCKILNVRGCLNLDFILIEEILKGHLRVIQRLVVRIHRVMQTYFYVDLFSEKK